MTEWEKFVKQFITLGGYKRVLDGLLATIEIAVFGLIIGIIIGTLIGIVKVMPKNNIFVKIIDKIFTVYVAFFRGTPMVVQLLLGHFIVLPLMKINVDAVIEAIVIFGMNSGAYVSEIMRGGINSVDKGQLEAGRAVGLGYWTAMFKIVIPQSIKNILPTLGNEFISLIKETSVVSFIAVTDLTRAFRQLGDATYSYLVPYLMLAAIYLVLVLLISWGVKAMERRFKKNER
ncbi:MAG: amino acid ABC transporter permease [Clostridia bacterium]|nr:amino acid ABC transporter permease [Clostridia bacterium]